MKVHVLTDNRVDKYGFKAEHGLSLFIEHHDLKILFDTGQSDVYVHNAKTMALNLNETDFIVLSHGQTDHCGGLLHFPETDPFPKIYAHPKAFENAGETDKTNAYFLPWPLKDYPVLQKNMVFNKENITLPHGVHIIGNIPSVAYYEDEQEAIYKGEAAAKIKDAYVDEQMLVIETALGLAVFLSCRRPGVKSCVSALEKIFPGKTIYALIAGLHSVKANSSCIETAIRCMLDLNIQKIFPFHCADLQPLCEMKHYLGERCKVLCTGDSFEL